MNFLNRLKLFSIIFLVSFVIVSCEKQESIVAKELTEDQIEKRQYIIEGFQAITPCEADNLTYFFDNCFIGTDYEEAIPAGMEIYNESPTSLNFTQVDNAIDADIIFNCALGGLCGQGHASPPIAHDWFSEPNSQTFFPSGGSIGHEITLNEAWFDCDCTLDELDLCFFVHTVVHEVAHALGLYHNNVGSTGFYDPIHVEGTPTIAYDPGSIINSGGGEASAGNWCTPSCELNDNDILAFQTLYPDPEILGPDVICAMTSYYYCLPGELVGDWSGQKKKWLNENTPTDPLPTNCSTYNWAKPGVYTISVNVCGVIHTKQVTVQTCF